MDNKKITKWQKSGTPKVLVNKFGKSTISQLFVNPKTGQKEEFILFQEKDFIIVFAVTADQQVVTVRQYRHGCDKVIRELPAGGVEENESLEETVRRELLQETGYTAQKIVKLGPVLYSSSSNATTQGHPFLALSCQKTARQQLDESEDIAVELIPLAKWIKQCHTEIVEPNSIATTFRALSYLNLK